MARGIVTEGLSERNRSTPDSKSSGCCTVRWNEGDTDGQTHQAVADCRYRGRYWGRVAKLNEQKQKFLALTEEEQRAFLADKIGSKVPEDKLAEIQDAVISAVNGRS